MFGGNGRGPPILIGIQNSVCLYIYTHIDIETDMRDLLTGLVDGQRFFAPRRTAKLGLHSNT